jgi:hexosaminidase
MSVAISEPDVSRIALAPRPQRVTRRPGTVPVPEHVTAESLRRTRIAPHGLVLDPLVQGWLEVQITGSHCNDDGARLQGYELTIDPAADASVTITSQTLQGARAGVMTLMQLIRLFPGALPALHIHDWPSIAQRGVMLDVSRTRVPTMRHLFAFVDTLAELKYNHLQLYIEHTFAYAHHPSAWHGCSPITPDELRRLDSYSAERGVELAGNQNCFGHLAHWLRLPAYAHLAETHGDWMFDLWPRSGPFSLCPTDPRSLELVRELIAEQAACVRGPLFNIGCDETYDIAYGRSREAVEQRGRLAVYTDYVCDVAAIAREHGKQPMFWGDVAVPPRRSPQEAECLAKLRDAGLVALVWGYEPDAPFAEQIDRVHAAGMPAWACPGTSCWRSITGRTTQRRANVQSACTASRHSRAQGVLLCAWGDVGHWQQWPVTLHAIGQSADALWRGGVSDAGSDRTAHGPHLFSAAHGESIASWLEAMGDVDQPLRAVSGAYSKQGLIALRNATPIFASLHQPLATLRAIGHAQLWKDAATRLLQLEEELPDASALVLDELRWTWHLAAWSTVRACRALELQGEAEQLQSAARSTHSLESWYSRLAQDRQRLWLARARQGGLETSCAHDATVQGFLGD